MNRVYQGHRAEGRSCLFHLHGQDGMGRMSVVAEFFHLHHADFDTYVEVSARQPDGRMAPLGEMLGQALRALGVPETELEAGTTERAQSFQRVSAGRPFLMVIRDVVDVDQVEKLIPDSAPGAVVVVTSRVLLRGLLVHNFVDVPLSRLPREESRTLLTFSMDSEDVPGPVIDELAAICDDVPLLIRILGAQLRRRGPRAVERHLRELRASDAALLKLGHAQRVGRFLEVADGLVRELGLALRQLALLPGPDFGVAAAAMAMDVDHDRAEKVLEELADKHLVIFDEVRERYSLYRMVRTHSRRMADEIDGRETVKAAVEKITTWHLREAIPRDFALANRWRIGPEFELFLAAGLAPVPRAAAITWFDAEWQSVVACVRVAHEHGLHQIAWQLCVAVFKYLHLHGHVDSWIDCHLLGVRSTEVVGGDVAGRMQVTSQRGAAYLAIGDTKAARRDFETSRQAAAEIDHRSGLQSAWEWLGKTAAAEEDFDEAFRCFAASEAVIERSEVEISPAQRIRMRALLVLQRARVWVRLENWDRAATVSSVVEYFATAGETDNHAKCLLVLGDASFGSGEPGAACPHYAQAAELFAADQALRSQAGALYKLGRARHFVGDFRGAVKALRTATKLFLILGDPRADAAGALLHEAEGHL